MGWAGFTRRTGAPAGGPKRRLEQSRFTRTPHTMKNPSLKSILVLGSLALAANAPVFGSEAEDIFKRMDVNGDKKVTSTEHIQFAETMFNQTDADHNGFISAAECDSAQASEHKKVDQKATVTHMRIVDTDGDGQISPEENAAYAKSNFIRADRNSDGVLNEDEFEKFHHEMKEELKRD
jgi:Ca2+-binding EF-hand superfamily protein